jgi:hypothetical protein
MSVVGPTLLVVAGMGALLAAARAVMLVARDAPDDQVGRALTAHGACSLAFVIVAVLVDPLALSAFIELPLAIMAAAWGTAWILIGRGYGLRFGPSTGPPAARASATAVRSRAPREPHRSESARARR